MSATSTIKKVVLTGVSHPAAVCLKRLTTILSGCIIQAGGQLGPGIVKELLAAEFEVFALARPDSKTQVDGVTMLPTDYSFDSLTEVLHEKDAVIVTLGDWDIIESTSKVLIDAAIAAGVKRFVPSEWGA